MSLSSTTTRNDYTGNGSVGAYSYTFPIVADADLKITVRDTSNVENTLTLTTHYTVSGAGSSSGGTVTLVSGFSWMTSSNLTTSYKLTIRRNRARKQTTDLRNQSDAYRESLEDALDNTVLIAQSMGDDLDRALRLPETEAGSSAATTLPSSADRASKFLAFDSSGNPIASAGTVSSVPVSSFMSTVLDDTTAAAAATTLNVLPLTGGALTGSVTAVVANDASIQLQTSASAKAAYFQVKNSAGASHEIGVESTSDAGGGRYAGGAGSFNIAAAATYPVVFSVGGTECGRFDGSTGAFRAKGSNSNDSANAGDIGESVNSNVARSSPVSTTANTAKTVTSISLSAGTWKIYGAVGWRTGATTTAFYAGINTTTNTLPGGDNFSNFTAGAGAIATEGVSIASSKDYCIPLPVSRIKLSVTTTVYLIQQSDAANTVYGYLEAERPR